MTDYRIAARSNAGDALKNRARDSYSEIRFRHELALALLATAAMPLVPSPLMAQAVDEKRQESIDEIIVTARRTAENLQSTPVAVTAVTNQNLAEAQIDDVVGLQRAVPNLAITTNSTAGASATSFAIRGQANLGGTGANDPAVGLYVDDVYIGRPGGSLVELIDVQRAEVLRGPQGTLFGRNTTGGAVNIITNQPTDVFEGSIKARVGDYGLREGTVIVNFPLVEDQLAIRMVGQYSEHSGYNRNDFQDIKVGDRENLFLRPSIKYTAPSGSWDLTINADRTVYGDHGQPFVFLDYNPANSFLPTYLTSDPIGLGETDLERYIAEGSTKRTNYSNEEDFSEVRVNGVSGVLNVDFGNVQLKSISAYRDSHNYGINDLDATPYRLLTTRYDFRQHQVSQELQLSGDTGRLSWILGGFYFRERARENTASVNFITTVLTGGERRSLNDAIAINTSYALFGQVNYDLTNQIRVTAGLRQTFDTRKVIRLNFSTIEPFVACGIPVADLDDGVTCRQTLSENFDYLSYLFGIDYQIADDVFVYAKTSRAFLAGGWNTRSGANNAFDPEGIRDVEVGIKLDFFDRRLRTNLAAFYGKQTDLQRVAQLINPTTGQPVNFFQNAGKAHIQGIEFEAIAKPWRGMELRGTLGILDAGYDEFKDVVNIGTITDPEFVDVDRTGEDPLLAPDLTWSISATQSIPLPFGELSVHADYSYVGDQAYFTNTASPFSSPAAQAAAQRANELGVDEGHSVLNAQLTLLLLDDTTTISLWGRNLTGELYYNRLYPDLYPSLGWALGFTAPPRTYGVSASYSF